MTYALYTGLTRFAWAAAWPWLAFKRRTGGREWLERTGELPACPGGIWVHAASVGEVAAAAPLVTALRDRGERVLLSVMTPTGRAAAARLEGEAVAVAFPPLDLPSCVDRALDAVRPRALLIVETELWPSLIVRGAARGVRVAIVNGRLSASSVRRYRSVAFPTRAVVDSVEFVACRSDEDVRRYLELGFESERLSVAGSLKYDTLSEAPGDSERASVRMELGAGAGTPVVVFGSVRPAEEEVVVLAARHLVLGRGCHVVIAPRHLGRAPALAARLSALGLAYSRRSEGAVGGPKSRVTLLDTTGELGRVYAAADAAFVGGTLAPYGGHNPLEPAAVGVPVVLGPHTSSCEEDARLLLERGAAVRVADGAGLLDALSGILDDPALRVSMSRRALLAVSSGRGATERIVELMRSAGIIGERRPEA